MNQALGLHYQVKSGGCNGWLVEGKDVEVVVGYPRIAGDFRLVLESRVLALTRRDDTVADLR